jgi:Flp pilus assembly protein TadG
MRRRNSSAGSALIEFAASLIVLSTMFAGIFEVGYTFLTYNTLVHAVRTGARYASLHAAAASAADPELAKAVRNLVVYGEPAPAPGAKPVVHGLASENVDLTLGPVQATVSLRNFEINALFSKVKLDGRPTVTFPLTNGVTK